MVQVVCRARVVSICILELTKSIEGGNLFKSELQKVSVTYTGNGKKKKPSVR